MSYAAARTAIAEHIGAQLDGVLTLRAENEARTGPGNATWARWSIRPIDSQLMTAHAVGGDQQSIGVLWFQIFLVESAGTKDAFAVSDIIASKFQQKRLTTGSGGVIYFDNVKLGYAGKIDGVTQFNATIRYTERAAAVVAA